MPFVRPTACTTPSKSGIYWLKLACVSHDVWTPEWVLADVDTKDRQYPIHVLLGSDAASEWENDDCVVVEVGPKVEAPT